MSRFACPQITSPDEIPEDVRKLHGSWDPSLGVFVRMDEPQLHRYSHERQEAHAWWMLEAWVGLDAETPPLLLRTVCLYEREDSSMRVATEFAADIASHIRSAISRKVGDS